MRVTIDGLLGSADSLKNQRQHEEGTVASRKDQVKTDSVTISSRINTRLDSIEGEFREIQSSLTKNQIIHNGIQDLQGDLARGGAHQEKILSETMFEGEQVLRNFVGSQITPPVLENKSSANTELMAGNIDRLKRLQVELDNIGASNLIDENKVSGIMGSVESYISTAGIDSIESISSLRPDAVMRLIR